MELQLFELFDLDITKSYQGCVQFRVDDRAQCLNHRAYSIHLKCCSTQYNFDELSLNPKS